MVNRGEIDYIKVGSVRKYNLNKYLQDNNISTTIKQKICYCRVSSKKQSEDLERQIEFMKANYPNHIIISDIGSGLNMERKGLTKIIDTAIKGEIEEVVVAYKDRLARFSFELIENLIIKYSGGRIVVINKSEEETPYDELSKDLISIMNVYVAKVNGLRKYKKKIKKTLEKSG
jgi:predicted site-specific integrase-resolvase